MKGFGARQKEELFFDEFNEHIKIWNFKYHLMIYYIKQNSEIQNTNQAIIIKELESEDPEIKFSMINTDLRLSLYLNDYKSIFINSTILSIISNFEIELKLITSLLSINQDLNNHKKLEQIILKFANDKQDLEILKKKLSFLINVRNNIIHCNNDVFNKKNRYNLVEIDCINFFSSYAKLESAKFYFEKYDICFYIINTINEFYSLIENNTLYTKVKE